MMTDIPCSAGMLKMNKLCCWWIVLCFSSGLNASVDLPAMGAIEDQTSISGLSSGGFMAAQYHVAYSANMVGAGIVAGGPWNCAGSDPDALLPPIMTAVSTCMNPCENSWFGCRESLFPDTQYLVELAEQEAEGGSIDALSYLSDDRIYIFSGKNDKTVVTKVVDTAYGFYRQLNVGEKSIRYNKQIEAGHAFITAQPDDTACPETKSPNINNCGFQQSARILGHIYGELQLPTVQLSGQLIQFNQRSFIQGELSSMDDDAYVYIPASCQTQACRVHVALHGCRQGASVLGLRYINGTGYNEVADSNRIIVLYPQVKKSDFLPMNPRGCWDFWGYSSNNLPPYEYYKKTAPQMRAIKSMVDRLISVPEAIEVTR